MSSPPRLAVERLRVVADGAGFDIVDEISFELEAGRTLGIVGESGSGKTTVGLSLLGYVRRGLRIDGGRILIDGTDVLTLPVEGLRAVRGAKVAYVPQDPGSALNPALRIRTQLAEMLESHGQATRRGAARERLEALLAEVRLDDPRVLDAYPHQLSGGQQQRVALAMAFALRPGVIVLDEPTTGLDVSTQLHVLETVRELCRRHGVAAVFVSHDLAVIGEITDSVAVMYCGRIVEAGALDAVFGAPAHPYTRALLRALPSPERSRELVGLTGRPPRPGARPAGCFFAPRCEFVREACRTGQPPLEPTGPGAGHLVRCIRAAELSLAPGPMATTASASSGEGDARRDVLLAARGIRASYGAVEILHDVSFDLRPSECLAIVGETGSGKTTLARCIVGLHRQWTGEITLMEGALSHAARRRSNDSLRRIQYVFQNPYGSLNPRRVVGEIVEQPLTRLSDVGPRERARRVVAALKDAALGAEFLGRYPGELSGGERQRVAIARALVVEPDVLVCDEITSSLDVSVQATIVEMLRVLQREKGLAMLFITHNLALVRSIAQAVSVMQRGEIVETGPTEAVLDAPRAEYTRALLRDIPTLHVPSAA